MCRGAVLLHRMRQLYPFLLFAFLFAGCSQPKLVQAQPVTDDITATDAYQVDIQTLLGGYAIDKDLQACMTRDPGTSGVTACYNEYLKRYEAQLNRTCARTTALLGPKAAAQLKTSQDLWQAHMEAELNLIEAQYKGMEGTQYTQIMALERLLLVRARCLQLQVYAQTLAADRD
jgi:uncharacterized protein YecT (DUF1311 family)